MKHENGLVESIDDTGEPAEKRMRLEIADDGTGVIHEQHMIHEVHTEIQVKLQSWDFVVALISR